MEITRTALADWVEAAAVALEPIYKAIRTDLIGGNYLQVDETLVRVMDPEVRGKTASGWLGFTHDRKAVGSSIFQGVGDEQAIHERLIAL